MNKLCWISCVFGVVALLLGEATGGLVAYGLCQTGCYIDAVAC